MPGDVRIEIGGGAAYLVPRRVVAADRAAFVASQAAGDPGPGNDEYDRVFANELQFALGLDSVLLEWASRQMSRADLERYRVEAEPDLKPAG